MTDKSSIENKKLIKKLTPSIKMYVKQLAQTGDLSLGELVKKIKSRFKVDFSRTTIYRWLEEDKKTIKSLSNVIVTRVDQPILLDDNPKDPAFKDEATSIEETLLKRIATCRMEDFEEIKSLKTLAANLIKKLITVRSETNEEKRVINENFDHCKVKEVTKLYMDLCTQQRHQEILVRNYYRVLDTTDFPDLQGKSPTVNNTKYEYNFIMTPVESQSQEEAIDITNEAQV